MRQFTKIKGRFSEARELPRIGKIRLGLKMQTPAGKTYPTEVEYFVCPPEVQEVYGEAPTELDVLLPSNDVEQVFRSKYAMYGAGAGLKCHGNGQEAERYNEGTKAWEPCVCPCPNLKSDENPRGACTAKSDLMVMLPLVSMGGCYQIKTGSAAATKNINSSLELVQMLTGGRFAFLPMKLRRVPVEMTHEGKKRTHYIMTITLNATWQQALELRKNPDSLVMPAQYQIAAPLDENPELDPVDATVEAEALAEMDDDQLAKVQQALKAKREGGPAKSAEPKPEPKPKPEPEPPADPGGQLPLEQPVEAKPARWLDVLAYIDKNPDLVALKEDWKVARRVTQVTRLTPAGEADLLAWMRQQAPGFPY